MPASELTLALETSTLQGSVALGRGREVVTSRELPPERRHTSDLLPAIAEMLASTGGQPRDVATVAFSQGPGSFTGLRVAATIARMWQSATGCTVVAVPSLTVIAQRGFEHPARPARVAAILDARQGRLFAAVYERTADGTLQAVQTPELVDAEAWLPTLAAPCHVTGDAMAVYRELIGRVGLTPLEEPYWRPTAAAVLALAPQFAPCRPHEIKPLYLRPPECEEVYDERRAAARARRGE